MPHAGHEERSAFSRESAETWFESEGLPRRTAAEEDWEDSRRAGRRRGAANGEARGDGSTRLA
jgi:hypothetical protein